MLELSKRKYVYEIYSSDDNVMHCEKHSIIFNNSHYTYFKQNTKNTLQYVATSTIKEKFLSIEDLRVTRFGISKHYFYEVEDFKSCEITELVFGIRDSERIRVAEINVNKYQEALDKAKENLNKLKHELNIMNHNDKN